MSFELFVALRYLFARRKQAFISLISLISMLGVTVGVMALVIALALMTGLQCSNYNTDVESVESCSVNVNAVTAPGEPLGTVGGPTANVVDWGHHDANVSNAFGFQPAPK